MSNATDKTEAQKAGYELALNLGPRVREALRPLNALTAEALNNSDFLALAFILECVSASMSEAIVIGKQLQAARGAGPGDSIQ